ncbi:hypothetical protein WICMUC_004780 [Wickerhamomyces mucosus]|uniref:polynucleotide adenylyltransferase n=1 Tax=Wickerhamomyces mucosus TaxID=1378264 RepID=A0A9P8PF86_9ASCO|nr:hypothetical protein WICMUC_004780 [Wickerhamomyces mucosus]
MSSESNKSKTSSKAKSFLKKSTNKLKRSFDVFQNKSHENKYKTLDADETDDEKEIKKLRNEIILLDSDEEGDTKHPIEILDDDSTGENDNKEINQNNELTDGADFISLKFSDSEASSGDENKELDNSDDEYSMDDNESNINSDRPTVLNNTPWIKDHDHSRQRELSDWLTMEIKDFIAYISPSKQEIETRNFAVRRLRESITKLWPDCEVHVFGSYATDLYLPGSDIDMVIVSVAGNYDTRNSLYQLSSYLKREKLARNVEVIAKAKVPIIKFSETHSNIHIDVSFERTNGITAARTIRTWLQETPGLRELVLIIKQFLSARRLNDVHLGGLGGYSIICLVYSFLKLHPRLSTNNINPLDNLGVLLIEFFELYGRNFGYDNVAICVEQDNVSYLKKSLYPELLGRNIFQLAIQDPSDPSNNISRGSFNIPDIKKAFNGAYQLLVNTCFDLHNATYRDRVGQSILGNVIKYKGKERDFKDERDLVTNEALQEGSEFNNRIVRAKSRVYVSDNESSEDDEVDDSGVDRLSNLKRQNINKKKKNFKKSEIPNKGKKVDEFMGIVDSEDESENQGAIDAKKLKRINSIDKDTKREYWLKKGNSLP